MAGARARIFGLVVLVACTLASCALLIFACAHWHKWWSLFAVLPCVLALLAPHPCYGYQPQDAVNTQLDDESFRACRELGWATAALLWLTTYAVPVLAWYNSTFPLAGVLVVDGAITCAEWAMILWIAFLAPVSRK